MDIRAASRDELLQRYVAPIEGWLNDYAARRTLDILASQEEAAIEGSLLEIGVYGGKYLAVLWQSALKTGSYLVGVDPFERFSEQQVIANLRVPADLQWRVQLVRKLSGDLHVSDLMDLLHSKARFVSVDGSHMCNDVFWDLRLAEGVLHPWGVVAVDDFLNIECLGVVEAVTRFLSQPRNLVPFLFTSNKLFMCSPARVEHYKAVVESGIRAEVGQYQSANFLERASHNRNWVNTDLCGYSLLWA